MHEDKPNEMKKRLGPNEGNYWTTGEIILKHGELEEGKHEN